MSKLTTVATAALDSQDIGAAEVQVYSGTLTGTDPLIVTATIQLSSRGGGSVFDLFVRGLVGGRLLFDNTIEYLGTATASLEIQTLPFRWKNGETLQLYVQSSDADDDDVDIDVFIETEDAPEIDNAAIAEAVAQYDQRDEEGTPGTIGWSFKKLRQANQAVEFVVTNDITPTTTTFSISLTSYDTSAFAHSVLLMLTGTAAEDNGVILTYTNNGTYATIVLEKPMANAPSVGDEGLIRADSHVHSVAEIAAGVWGATSAAYSAATGTFGRVLYAISTMIENVSGWRWTAASLSQAPTESGIGQYQITLVADSTGGQVPGVVFRIVGTVLNVTTGSDGEAILNLDAGTYTLRTVAPAGYEDVADTTVTIDGADDTATVTLTPTTTPAPPSADACVLSIYVRNQATEPFPGVTVAGRFPRGWSVADGAMNLNEVVTDTTDANGFARLVLVRDQEYDLSFARENGTIAKIRIRTPDAATATLNQSYQG